MPADPAATRRLIESLSTHLEDHLATWKSSLVDARREIETLLAALSEKIPVQAKPLFAEDVVGIMLEEHLGGAALFAVSFPTFYYGAIGYVEPVAIAFLAAAVLLVVRGRFAALVPVIAVGCLAKETVLVAAPAALWAAARAAPGRRLRSLLFAAAAFLAGALALIAVRLLVPGGPSRLNTPSLALFLANASRPRAWLSVLLTLGPPAAALAVGLAAGEGRRRLRGHLRALRHHLLLQQRA